MPGDFGDRVFAPEWVTVVVPPSPMYLIDVHERACADLELALVSLLAGSPLGSSARPIVAANRAKDGLAVGDGDKSPLGVADVVVRDLLELNLASDLEVQLVQRVCAKRARLIERPRPNTFASPTDLPAKSPTQKDRRGFDGGGPRTCGIRTGPVGGLAGQIDGFGDCVQSLGVLKPDAFTASLFSLVRSIVPKGPMVCSKAAFLQMRSSLNCCATRSSLLK